MVRAGQAREAAWEAVGRERGAFDRDSRGKNQRGRQHMGSLVATEDEDDADKGEVGWPMHGIL
jgi:hypothetical protein